MLDDIIQGLQYLYAFDEEAELVAEHDVLYVHLHGELDARTAFALEATPYWHKSTEHPHCWEARI